MIQRSFRAVLLTLGIALAIPGGAEAQIQASERATVAQTIDGTTLTLAYSRPVARGRDLFGALVPWNVVWTPGANWATTLEVDADITLNGVQVPAGDYSVWAIPREDRFTITLNPDPRIFHFQKPDSTDAQIHISAVPEAGSHTEMLTWHFPMVRGDAARLEFRWGETVVPMQVMVPPTRPTITEDEAAMYVGVYEATFHPALGGPESGRVEVFMENGKLKGRMPFTLHPPDDPVFDMVPMGGTRFNPGLYHDGAFFNVEMGVGFDFTLDMERAVSFELRGGEGSLFGGGKRIR